MLLDDSTRSLFVDREVQARAAAESLRLGGGPDPDDRATAEFISELREKSSAFDQWRDRNGSAEEQHTDGGRGHTGTDRERGAQLRGVE